MVLDSSTLILSAKIDLLGALAGEMRLEIPEAVKKEVLRKPDLIDAKLIARFIDEGKISIEKLKDRKWVDTIQKDFHLGDGESEAIALAKNKSVLLGIDDGVAIKVCRIMAVSFVSALSLLVFFHEKGALTQNQALAKLEKLKAYGWYHTELLNQIYGKIQGGQKT